MTDFAGTVLVIIIMFSGTGIYLLRINYLLKKSELELKDKK